MRIGDLSAPSRRFVARVTAAVTTDGYRPDRGELVPAADTAFASVFAVPFGGATGSAEAPAAATSVVQHAPPTSSTPQGADYVEITDPAAPAPLRQGDPAPPTALPPSGRISTRTRRRTAAATGAEPPAVDYASGPAGPLVHPLDVLSTRRESHGRDRLWPSLRPLLLPLRLP